MMGWYEGENENIVAGLVNYDNTQICKLKKLNYHQNGHVAFAETCLSRIWRVLLLCSSVPTLAHRLNAKSQGPWRESQRENQADGTGF